MTVAASSATPLVRKLGVGPGQRIGWLGAPVEPGVLLGEPPPGVRVLGRLQPPLDVVVQFTTSRAALARRLRPLRDAVFPDGIVWIAWPKRASGVASDLTEDVVRALALEHGLVDVKVCAIDATWSGLKLVVRVRDRR